MDEFGHAGYVAWFGLIETISKENGNKLTGKLDIKPGYLKRKLRISTKKLEEIFEFCSIKTDENFNKTSTKPKLLFEKDKEKWFFELPKLLELKDNYTKDLQGAGKKPSNHKEAEEEKEKKAEEEKRKYLEDSNEFRVALFLFKNIKKNKPDFKKPNLQAWAKDADLLLRIDKRNIEEVKQLITWIQNDDFESVNVLSVSKLRKRYDQLYMKMQSSKPGHQPLEMSDNLNRILENAKNRNN